MRSRVSTKHLDTVRHPVVLVRVVVVVHRHPEHLAGRADAFAIQGRRTQPVGSLPTWAAGSATTANTASGAASIVHDAVTRSSSTPMRRPRRRGLIAPSDPASHVGAGRARRRRVAPGRGHAHPRGAPSSTGPGGCPNGDAPRKPLRASPRRRPRQRRRGPAGGPATVRGVTRGRSRGCAGRCGPGSRRSWRSRRPAPGTADRARRPRPPGPARESRRHRARS
jgi:hypothetical protein